jgi:16S rRNA processing protein RimM
MPTSPYIVIGKIGSTFGVHGWLKVLAYTEYGANILEYTPWYLSTRDNELVEADIEDSRIQHNTVLVKFRHIDTPEEAATFTNKTISIRREQLPELKENEFYWSDLVGLDVIDKEGKNLGKVIYMMSTGSNDVLVVKGEKEHGIPYLPGKVVLNVDLEKRQILVDWEPII